MVALELDIRPGLGVGNFNLGASLWAVLELLQQHKTIHPQVDIKFDSSNPVSSPVVVHVRPHLDLLFSPLDQRLTLINIRKMRSGHALVLKYRDKVISSTSTSTGNGTGTVFRKATVSQVFGPTYPGDVMRYPGIWFGFEEDGSAGHVGVPTHLAHSPPEERNQEVKRIVVTQRMDGDEQAVQERDALDEAIECPEMYGDLKKASVKLDRETGASIVELSFYLPPTASPAQTAPVEIRIGETTAQDLIAEIGSPPRVHYKEDDRMLIHKTTTAGSAEDDESEGYFYNYFQYGMDILLSGSTHVVQKVVFHSNVPGSHLFQRYKRCPWEIEVPGHSLIQSPPLIAMPLPTLIDSSTLEHNASKGNKKARKKAKGLSPEPLLDILPDPEQLPEVEQVSGEVQTVSLFTKVDDFKKAFGPSPSTHRQTSRPMAIPSRAPSVPQTPRSAISRQFAQLAMSTSPPTMVLDRSSETGNTETTSSVGGTTQLMGFEGMVAEVSELGDILSVMIF